MSDSLAVTVIEDGATRLYRPRPDGGVDEFAVVAATFTPVDAVRLTAALVAFVAECGVAPSTIVDVPAPAVHRATRPRAVGPRPRRHGRVPGAMPWSTQVRDYLAEHPEGATNRELDEALPRPDLRSSAAQRLGDLRARGVVSKRGDRFFLVS